MGIQLQDVEQDEKTVNEESTGTGSILRENCRLWHLIINNPSENGVTEEIIKETLNEACENGRIQYWASIREQSIEDNPDTGKPTIHIHLIIYFPGKQRGGWLHKRFPTAAIFPCKASVPSLILYITKNPEGAWYKTHPEKIGEKLPSEEACFYEWGDMPQATRQKNQENSYKILQDISEGKSDFEIISENPKLWKQVNYIRQARSVLLSERFSKEYRKLDVTYIEGTTGTGKTRFVMEQTGYELFKIDDYDHPWDGYAQQDTIFLDEFRSQPNFSEILQWLDGNPLTLKARYSNGVACYTRVFIASNWSLEEQYYHIAISKPHDWQALLRRIHHRRVYAENGTYTDYNNVNGNWIASETKENNNEKT